MMKKPDIALVLKYIVFGLSISGFYMHPRPTNIHTTFKLEGDYMSKLIISGIRTCSRKDTVFAEINKFSQEIGGIDEIVAGGSTGVDLFAKMYAESEGIKYKEFAPNWQDDLNAAGIVRDTLMAEYGTHLLVLSNGLSKESKNLIEEAKSRNLVIKTVGSFVGVPESERIPPMGIPTF